MIIISWILAKYREWQFARTVKKIYIKKLVEMSGIPKDKLIGLEAGTLTGAEIRESGDEL